MYQRKRHLRVWATIPAVALIVAISAIAGPANAATYTPTLAMPAPAAATLSLSVAPVEEFVAPTVVTAVGATALQIPVAATTIQRLPATSTIATSGQPMVLGFLLGLLGTLLIFASRKSLIQRVINIYTR